MRFTEPDLDEREPVAPHDQLGRFLDKKCPVCGNGTLKYQGNGHWRCDGLDDPNDSEKSLIACENTHEDGTPIKP